MMSAADRVASRVQGAFDQSIATLSGYLRVPSISCDKAHAKDVRQLASRIESDLQALGLERARVLELDGALPSSLRNGRRPDRTSRPCSSTGTSTCSP